MQLPLIAWSCGVLTEGDLAKNADEGDGLDSASLQRGVLEWSTLDCRFSPAPPSSGPLMHEDA